MKDDQDRYEEYYSAKLWNLIPPIYRTEDSSDFKAAGPLRELVNRIGAQAAVLRRSIDRLWEDQSIETCDDWIIPYIGDLLATNLVNGPDARGQRLDVAKTIHYRRRAGTVAIIEEVALDITGWNAKVVEFFRRMARTRHGLDPVVGLAPRVAGGVIKDASNTTPIVIKSLGHGLGDNDNVVITGVISAGADPSNANGSFAVERVDADHFRLKGSAGNGEYISRGAWERKSSEATQSVVRLQHANDLVGMRTGTHVGGVADLRNVYGATKAHSAFDEFFHTADLRTGRGQTGWHNIPRLGIFLWRLISFAAKPTTPVKIDGHAGWYSFDPTGRYVPLFAAGTRTSDSFDQWESPLESQLPTPISQALFDAPDSGSPIYPDSLTVFPRPPGREDTPLSLDKLTVRPECGQFHFNGDLPEICVKYHYGFSSSIGAGPYDRPALDPALEQLPPPLIPIRPGGGPIGSTARRGTLTLSDSLTYFPQIDLVVNGDLTIRAENGQRPVLRLRPPRILTITSITKESRLVLDGLLLSGADIVLRGDFASVTITYCTLDPGSCVASKREDSALQTSIVWSYAAGADGPLTPCRLRIEGTVNALRIERSITGPIRTECDGNLGTLNIADSIIQALPNSLCDDSAIDAECDASLTRCTVLGKAKIHRLHATDCIFQGGLSVMDVQHGCVRFSAWTENSVVPRQYESVRIKADAQLFTTTDFGQPGYCQLLATVDSFVMPEAGSVDDQAPPRTISSGAENGSEMGAFARELNPAKELGLRLKLQEFMPAGLVPVLIFVT